MQSNLNEENIAETTAMVAEVVQEADQSVANVLLVRNVVATTAFLVASNPSVVDEEVRDANSNSVILVAFAIFCTQTVDGVVEILNGLQNWPPDVVQSDNTGAESVDQ